MYASVLTPVERTPHGTLSAAMRDGCRRVFERTGVRAFLDRKCGIVIFGYGDTSCRVDLLDITVPVKRASGTLGGFCPLLDKFTVDDVCRLIGLARVDWKMKLHWQNQHKINAQYDKARASEALADDQSREVLRLMDFEKDKLHQGRHYRRSVTV